MKTLPRIFIATIIAGLTAAAAFCQAPSGPRGAFNPEQFIDRRMEQLDNQLNLTPDQEKKIRAVYEKAFKSQSSNNGARSRRDRLNQDRNQQNRQQQIDDEIKKVLTPDQVKKYDAMPRGRGRTGGAMGVDGQMERLTERLKLTADQQKKVRAILEKQGEEMRKAFEEMRQGGDREAMREKFQEMREKNEKEIEAALTAEQKKEYAAMRQEMMQRMQRGGGNRGQR